MLAGDLTLAIRGRSLDASHASVRLANLKIDLLIQFWRILRKWQVDVASVEGGRLLSDGMGFSELGKSATKRLRLELEAAKEGRWSVSIDAKRFIFGVWMRNSRSKRGACGAIRHCAAVAALPR